MLQRSVGYRVQGRTVHGLIPQRAARIPPRASNLVIKVVHAKPRAGVTCRAQVRPNEQPPSATSGSVDRNCRDVPSFFTYTRMIFLTGVMAASVFLDKRSAHAATPPTPVVTQDRHSTQPTRHVWTVLKSVGNAPFYALDHLLFPDADEPISIVRTSREYTAEHTPVATAKPSPTAHLQAKKGLLRAEAAPTTAAQPPVITAAQAPRKINTPASKGKGGSVAGAKSDDVATYLSSAAANSYQQLSSSLSAALNRLAPSWPAESVALSGLSQLPAGLRSRVCEAGGAGYDRASSALLARQLVRGAYALGGILVAVMAWQLAAAIPGADRSAKKVSKATTAGAASAAPKLQQAVFMADSGVSVAALQPDDVRPTEPQYKQVVGPYCIRPNTACTAAADVTAVDKQQQADVVEAKIVVGPYCRVHDKPPAAAAELDAVHEALIAEAAAMQAAPAADDTEVPGSLAVVGPYCLMSGQALQPAAAAAAADDTQVPGSLAVVGPYCLMGGQALQPAAVAADVVHEALVAEAAALQAAAEATAVDTELSVVLATETAQDTAQGLVDTAASAAAAVDQHEESAFPAAGDSTFTSHDDEPLFRVDISHAPTGGVQLSLSGIENSLAAEAVREALVAESAAATAAVAAERANAAAHKIEEAIIEEAAHAAAAASASHKAPAAEQQEAGTVTSALTDSAIPDDKDVVWELATEAKHAEAVAAMACIRQAAKVSSSSSTSFQAAVDQGELHALIAEAIAAEAAAAAVAGIAANVNQAELVAEAVAAEAAAAAVLAAADAAGSAAAADVSAGQAAELAKCHLCGPRADSAAVGSSGSQLQLSSSVSVSWMVPSADNSALQQLTALAAATAHPAIVTSTTTATSTVETAPPPSTAAVDDADSDAFKDEFPMDDMIGIAAVDPDDGATAPAADSRTCSLADALNVASQIQMQAASATAVKQAHERLVHAYKARRPAPYSDAAKQQPANQVPAQKLPEAALTAARRQMPAGVVAKAAGGYLGVSDLALALALAQLDAREPGNSNRGQSKDGARQEKNSQTGQSSPMSPASSSAPAVAAEDTTVVTPAAPPVLEQPANHAAAGLSPESVVEPVKPGEIIVTYADSSSSGGFHVPIIKSGGNLYTALADALSESSSRTSKGDSNVTSKGNSSTDEAISKDHAIPITGSSGGGFEVAVVTEGSARDALSTPTSTHSSSKAYKGLRKELGRGAPLWHYVPVNGGSTGLVSNAGGAGDAASSASIAVLPSLDRGASPGAQTGNHVVVVEFDSEAKPADEAPEDQSYVGDKELHGSSDGSFSSGSIPVEWIATPNSSKRAELHQRAAVLLAAQTAAETEPIKSSGSAAAETAAAAERSAVSQAGSGAGQFSGVASTAVALVADEIDTQVKELLSSAAGRLEMDIADVYGMPDIISNWQTAAAESLPAGWGSGSAIKAPTNTPTTNSSSSSWSEVSAQLAADLEDELAGLLTSAAARLDYDTMINAYGMPQVPLPAAAEVPSAEATAATRTADDDATAEPFGRYLPVAKQDKAVPSSMSGTADA